MKLRALLIAALAGTAAAASATPTPPTLNVPSAPEPQMAAPCPAQLTVAIGRGQVVNACILQARGWAYLVLFNPADYSQRLAMPFDHDMIFTLLASTDMAPLWPQIIAFTGEDGGKLRTASRARSQNLRSGGWAAPKSTNQLENFVSGSVLATMQAADLALDAGDGGDAIGLLQAKRAGLELGGLKSSDKQFDWVSLAMREAKLQQALGNVAAATSIYDAISANQAIYAGYRVNGAVNKAAMLAELGQAAQSLALINQAENDFKRTSNGPKVPGSDRQFAWIKACDYHLLGNEKEARKAIAVIQSAPAELRNAKGMIAPTSGIEIRLAFCLKDDAMLAGIVTGTQYAVDPAALLLQEKLVWFPRDRSVTIDLVRQRFAKSGYAPRMRQIPVALVPAMNRWLVPVDQLPSVRAKQVTG